MKKRLFYFVVVFLLLVVTSISLNSLINRSFSLFTICPNGKIAPLIFLCLPTFNQKIDDSQISQDGVILNEGKEYIIKSNGILKIQAKLEPRQRLWINIEPGYSNNSQFDYFALNPSGQFNQPEDARLILLSDNTYSFTFSAPSTPGDYKITVVEPKHETYFLKVIGQAKFEQEAFDIASKYLYYRIRSKLANLQDWSIYKKEIVDRNNTWKVSLKVRYQICGIDWDAGVCSNAFVSGVFTIDKKTGTILSTSVL